ncbi:cyclic nucleotide-binding domain-containing protein [Nocardioides humilatus]|uniref:NADH:ubiquinone reductase (non-electrogenic) n=1 Tax=Nocardioides humilatus TaxID=2607660 RepID=A0A5B1L610_9ACTN|nr:FAD-dependent oxidoreductase [Nocardioides humilatus]KAA1415945.1 cyclic nucleotide-binding domain-containing protein [Nocardioides humilatus]
MVAARRKPLRVVCLGGGWTAIYLSRSLKKAINKGDVELTIVSRDNFHTFHGFIAEMLTGKVSPTNITSPSRRLFPPARFHNAEIKSVDVEKKTVTTSRLLDGKEQVLDYDHLVIALGSIDDLSRYPGIAQHALQLKTYSDNFKVRSHLLAMLEMAEAEPDPVERRRLLTFVVVGAGFGGVEVATELMDYFQRLARKEYAGLDPDEIRVVLVHSGDRILPELGERQPKLIGYAEKTIAKAGIEVMTGTRISAATRDEAILSDGTVVPTRSIISSSGTALSPLLDLMPYERDDRGRVITDANVQVPGTDDVWAAGDCAAVPHPQGGTCPAVAIYAMYAGKQIGRNIVRQMEGKPLKPFTFPGLGDACSLGRRKAVSHLKGFRFYGTPAWIVWRLFFWWFVPTWERKADIAFDWLCAPFFGRDIVGVGVATPYGLRREHYETGQPVVRQGEVGQAIYVITSGTAEIIRETPEGPVVVTTLGSGDHFGEKAVFEKSRRTATVRATSPLEVLSLGEAEARALAETISVFGAAVRELPNEPEHNPAPLSPAG